MDENELKQLVEATKQILYRKRNDSLCQILTFSEEAPFATIFLLADFLFDDSSYTAMIVACSWLIHLIDVFDSEACQSFLKEIPENETKPSGVSMDFLSDLLSLKERDAQNMPWKKSVDWLADFLLHPFFSVSQRTKKSLWVLPALSAKRKMARLFLPEIPFTSDRLKNKFGAEFEDWGGGIRCLSDLFEASALTADDCIIISIMYLTGTVVEQDLSEAKTFFDMAQKLDSHKTLDATLKKFLDEWISDGKQDGRTLCWKIRTDADKYVFSYAEEHSSSIRRLKLFLEKFVEDPAEAKHSSEQIQLLEEMLADDRFLASSFIWNTIVARREIVGVPEFSAFKESSQYLSTDFFDLIGAAMVTPRRDTFYEGNINKPFSTDRIEFRPINEEYNHLLVEAIDAAGELKSYLDLDTKDHDYFLQRPLSFALYNKANNTLIGEAALNARGYGRFFAVEYWITPPYRRQGYAKEALRGLIDLAFSGKMKIEWPTALQNVFETKRIRAKYLVGWTAMDNIASQKTMESAAFKKVEKESVLFEIDKANCVFYRISYKDWKENTK